MENEWPWPVRASLAVYAGLLRLYPHSFWRSYREELEADFDEGNREAYAVGGMPALVRWWMHTVADLMRSLAREWLRTPSAPIVCVLASCISSVIFVGVWVRGKRAFSVASRAERTPDSPELLLLMALMVLIPVVATILFWWTLRFTNLRERRWRKRV